MASKPTYKELEQRIHELEKADIQNKKTIADLKENERRLQSLFMNAPLPYQSLDEHGNFLEVNQTFMDILGYSKEEIIGKNFRDFLHPDWADHFKTIFSEFKATGEIFGVEFEMSKKDGSIIRVQFNGKIQKDERGRFQRTQCVFQDISEQKQMEQALRDSEKKYRMLYEGAGIGIFHSTFEGKFLDVNPCLAKMLGYETPEEVIDSIYNIAEQIYAEPRDRDKVLDQLLTEGETIKVENRYIRKDGTQWDAYLHLRYVLDSKGEPMYLEGFVEDITERKRIEEELKESKMFLDKMSDIAYITDTQGNVLWVNRAAEQIIGLPREQIINKPFLPLFIEKDHASMTDAYQRTLKGQTLEHTSTLKNGIICQFTSLPKRNKQGDIIGTFGVGRDITDRIKNEKERLEMQKEVKRAEKAESLSRMAGAVAHHFNNMLFAVIGYLGMAREDLPTDSDVSENLANAEKAANKAAEISRFMLTYLGQEPCHFQFVDFSLICKQYLAKLHEELPEKIELTSSIPFSSLIIKADQAQIQQTVEAIVTNSVESIEDQAHGRIHVSIEIVKAETIDGEICFPNDWEPSSNEYVSLTVRDTGKGINEKAKELIFDPFYTDKFTGRGLGLAMVLGIVKSHDGCITVDSTVGKGTTIRVFLPQPITSSLDA